MAKIYAADDEKDIREIIQAFLESDGHEVITFETGDALYEKFVEYPSDVVLLDIMMPGTDGLMICNKIRKISKVPIMLLTAKDTDSDYIAGLSLGSDDYMTKPFRPTILTAKIRALLRRVELERKVNDANSSEQNMKAEENQGLNKKAEDIVTGDLKYIHKEHEIYCKNKKIKLTTTEFNFLLYFMKRENEAVAKDQVLDDLWGYSAEIETRVADETSRRLRKKLQNAESEMYIQTVWGYGFKFMKKEKPE
jgi:DNA-binding response OmpR family regulator